MSFLDNIAEPGIRTLYQYWLKKRQGSTIPRKRNIDPAELPPELLPWMFMYRRELDEKYRCVLSGTGIALIDGQDATNRYLHEVEPAAAADNLRQLFAQTLEQGLPLYFSGRRAGSDNRDGCLAQILLRNGAMNGKLPGRTEHDGTTLLLPMSDNRLLNNHILGIFMFGKAAPTGSGEQFSRRDEPRTVLQATPEDLLRRALHTQVA